MSYVRRTLVDARQDGRGKSPELSGVLGVAIVIAGWVGTVEVPAVVCMQ